MIKKIILIFGGAIFLLLLFFSLNVEKPVLETLSVETISMNEEYLVLKVGSTQVILANVYPYNANNQNIIWSSSNDNLASVENGVVTAHSVGNVQITAMSEDGEYSDYCYIDIIS